MTVNVGTADRIFRLVVGLALLLLPFVGGLSLFESNAATTVSIVVGLILVGTSAMRFCPLYRIIGVRTCKA